MSYEVTLTFLVQADSEDVLERYVDRVAFELAEREGFLLDNRTVRALDVPLTGSYRTITAADA